MLLSIKTKSSSLSCCAIWSDFLCYLPLSHCFFLFASTDKHRTQSPSVQRLFLLDLKIIFMTTRLISQPESERGYVKYLPLGLIMALLLVLLFYYMRIVLYIFENASIHFFFLIWLSNSTCSRSSLLCFSPATFSFLVLSGHYHLPKLKIWVIFNSSSFLSLHTWFSALSFRFRFYQAFEIFFPPSISLAARAPPYESSFLFKNLQWLPTITKLSANYWVKY